MKPTVKANTRRRTGRRSLALETGLHAWQCCLRLSDASHRLIRTADWEDLTGSNGFVAMISRCGKRGVLGRFD